MTKDKGPRTKQPEPPDPRTPEPPELYPPVVFGDIVDPRIVMGHGAGGRKMHRLIKNVFVRNFGSPVLRKLADGAVLPGFSAKVGTVRRSAMDCFPKSGVVR